MARYPSSPPPSAPQSPFVISVEPPPPYEDPHPTLPSSPCQHLQFPDALLAFPEPELYRSPSDWESLQAVHTHNSSDFAPSLHRSPSANSSHSIASSYHSAYYDSAVEEEESLSQTLSSLSLDFHDALRRCQAGELPENAQEWHCLVPVEAQEALGKQEVRRQSVLFEAIKSERDYVADLCTIQDVFIEGLRNSHPAIMEHSHLMEFINVVFGNLADILAHHHHMLERLFARQREQHPLVQSIADIILDTTLQTTFRHTYETYIKHYPLAESHHRREAQRNHAYASFLQASAADPRIRKRDLVTFLSRPVTRLPRLGLLLEETLKRTDKEHEHPDLETLPIILGLLADCVKSAQPGIEAAENKVKFWELCESLVMRENEIIDLDLYDESRTLIHAGPVVRKMPGETGFSNWVDLELALLDHYLLLTKKEKGQNSAVIRRVVSRPIPLSFIHIGKFSAPPETRRKHADDGRMLDGLRYQSVPLYPFTIFHAARPEKTYTLFVTADAQRRKWISALEEGCGVHRVRQDSNPYFELKPVTNWHSRGGASAGPWTGIISSATSFRHAERKYIAVAHATGIYVATWGSQTFHKFLTSGNVKAVFALVDKLVVHVEGGLRAYPLDELARVASGGSADVRALEKKAERVASADTQGSVSLARFVQIGTHEFIVYATKRRLGSTMTLHVVEADASRGFNTFGEAAYLPRDAYDVVPSLKTVGVCTSDGIIIMDPTNVGTSAFTVIPDLQSANTEKRTAKLKARLEGSRPLGLTRVDVEEIMLIYDDSGCFITKFGVPTRACAYIKWETKASAYAVAAGRLLLLFSSSFVEVRNLKTGRLVQVIEGEDVRLLYASSSSSAAWPEDGGGMILMGIRAKDSAGGWVEQIVELTETRAIGVRSA